MTMSTVATAAPSENLSLAGFASAELRPIRGSSGLLMNETLVFRDSILSSLTWGAGELRINLEGSLEEFPGQHRADGDQPLRSPVMFVVTSPRFVPAPHSITRTIADGVGGLLGDGFFWSGCREFRDLQLGLMNVTADRGQASNY
jgi:hypothetical protein